MKVAVIMSTYNGEKYLECQIDSILNQQGDFQLDLWVRDDGSNDTTCDILEKYAADGKLKWYSDKNLGPAKSFMELLQKCDSSYDYYAFSDQDDYWEKDKLQRGITTIKKINEPCLYMANAELVNSELNSLGRNVYIFVPRTDFQTLTCAGGLLGCTMIFNNQLAEIVCKNRTIDKIIMHDFYVAAVCAAVGGTIFYDEKPCIKYRQHGNNVVGVSYGFLSVLKQRFKDILSPAKVSIAEQAEEILVKHMNDIEQENLKWLKYVANYRMNICNRISLAFSNKVRFINKNMAIKIRMSILLGNR